MDRFLKLSFDDVALLRASLGSYYKCSKDTISRCNCLRVKSEPFFQDIKKTAFRHAVDSKTMLLRLDEYAKVL